METHITVAPPSDWDRSFKFIGALLQQSENALNPGRTVWSDVGSGLDEVDQAFHSFRS